MKLYITKVGCNVALIVTMLAALSGNHVFAGVGVNTAPVAKAAPPPQGAIDWSPNAIKYFGFTFIDVGWDDPLDDVEKTNFLDEVKDFTNVADIMVYSPDDNIVERMKVMNQNGVKAYLHVYPLFFEHTGSNAPSGNKYQLLPDYQSRWKKFLDNNNIPANLNLIQAFYVGEEPTWNGISYEELKTASDHIRATLPQATILVVEGYPALDAFKVPTSVDWVGFDHYFVKDPLNDPTYQKEFTLLKSKLSTPEQKLVVVMDAQYVPYAHGAYNIMENDMLPIATSYYNLARSDDRVIALFCYTWAGGSDDKSAKGARQLSPATIAEYKRIGKLITGK